MVQETKRSQLSVKSWAPARRPSAHSAKAVTGCEWPDTNGSLESLKVAVSVCFSTQNKVHHDAFNVYIYIYIHLSLSLSLALSTSLRLYFRRAFGCKSLLPEVSFTGLPSHTKSIAPLSRWDPAASHHDLKAPPAPVRPRQVKSLKSDMYP